MNVFVPAHVGAPPAATSGIAPGGDARAAEGTPKRSQLAVAAFVLGLLALPLPGFVLGPIALVCAVMALAATQTDDGLRGTGLAIAGATLGTLGMAGWAVGVWIVLSRPSPSAESGGAVAERSLREMGNAQALDNAPPHIRRAVRANVEVRCGEASGSGIVVGVATGGPLILTNHHVVDCDDAEVEIKTADGQQASAVRLWRAPHGVDLELLQAEAGALPRQSYEVMPISREPAQPRVGDAVFAVGNPLGFQGTYTSGSLSAVRETTYEGHAVRVLQVQVSINPGNSGGGLYDAAGRLLGVTTWTGRKAVSEGLGFAIAIDEVIGLADGAQWTAALITRDAAAADAGRALQ